MNKPPRVEVAAAASRRDLNDLDMYGHFLQSTVEEALPSSLLLIERHQSVAGRLRRRPGWVVSLSVTLDDRRYVLQPHRGAPRAEIVHVIRGLELDHDEVALDIWINQLVIALSRHAEGNARVARPWPTSPIQQHPFGGHSPGVGPPVVTVIRLPCPSTTTNQRYEPACGESRDPARNRRRSVRLSCVADGARSLGIVRHIAKTNAGTDRGMTLDRGRRAFVVDPVDVEGHRDTRIILVVACVRDDPRDRDAMSQVVRVEHQPKRAERRAH